jgi:ribosomal protein S18 acetylase RimI-like enzyme
MIETTALRPDHLVALYQLYRTQTAGLPHCLPPSPARFAADLTRPDAGEILVAEAGGRGRGFAAMRVVADEDDQEAEAITALFFDDEAAGAALLDACLRRAGPGPLLAFPQTDHNAPVQGYNAGWDGLSEGLGAQARLLAERGFTPFYRELLLTRELGAAIHAPEELPGFVLEEGAGDRGGYRQRAWASDERVGLCLYDTLTADSDDPRAARTGIINWVWADERLRRRGIARALTLRALAHLQTLGCKAGYLTTGAENGPAQSLYAALGFVVVDSAVSLVRPGP